jgi:hypothetical protein
VAVMMSVVAAMVLLMFMRACPFVGADLLVCCQCGGQPSMDSLWRST